MNLDNMILALRCAEDFSKSLEPAPVELGGLKGGYVDFNPAIFDEAMRPLMIKFESLYDVETIARIIGEEIGESRGRITECLVFRLAHVLYHEAFDVEHPSHG